jgi:hypothetical protein
VPCNCPGKTFWRAVLGRSVVESILLRCYFLN